MGGTLFMRLWYKESYRNIVGLHTKSMHNKHSKSSIEVIA